jgi:hypothetical protein
MANQREAATGACKKCGYVGHLAYQCRNFIKLKPQQDVVLDVSSTSTDSSDDETPLTAVVGTYSLMYSPFVFHKNFQIRQFEVAALW